MARSFSTLITHALLATAATLGALHAQNPEPPPEPAHPRSPLYDMPERPLMGEPPHRRPQGPPPQGKDPLQEMNRKRWAAMPPEEKERMRKQMGERREKARMEIEEAMSQLKIPLDGPLREEFMERYAKERRAIEEEIRQQTEGIRKERIQALLARLKEEFSKRSPSDAAPTPTAPDAPDAPNPPKAPATDAGTPEKK